MQRTTPSPAEGSALRHEDWPRHATRWVQLTFAEDDPAHFDADFWTGLMRDSRANAICISAGGYIAYYPTRIPYHYRSKYLGDTDPFGTLVDAARSLGMHVMARVDPHAIHADAAEAHPEWLALDADGRPMEHWAFPGIWLTCPFSTYHREFITEVARELVRDYDIDAIFANRWQGSGEISYSEHARRDFFDSTGFDLPTDQEKNNPDSPVWQAWVAWRRRRLSELIAIWDDAVRDIRPHARFIPNVGSLAVRDMDRDLITRHYPIFFIDKQGRSGNEAPWSAGRNGKRSRGLFRDRPVGLITSVGPEHHHRWKDSVAPAEETRTWMVDGFAQGAFPWFTKFNATISDDRWVAPIVDAFNLHARLEPVLGEMPIVAEVAMLDPTQTDRAVSPGDRSQFAHEDGFYQALVEARIPFEFVADQVLSPEELSQFRVLVMPNAERLSDEQCAVIAAWVETGGNLVAAFNSSLRDEHGTPRDNFGLADTLGVDLTQPRRGPVKNNYVALTGEHRLQAGLEGARRIIGGTHLLGITARDGTEVPFRFIPDFPDLPMEEVYPREGPDAPAIVTRELPGGGRTVYVGFDIGSLFWEALQADHGTVIANAVRWALRDDERVRVEGHGMVDLAVRENDAGIAVSIVNLTNPMAMRGAIRETIPLADQRVKVRLPAHANGATGRLLVAERDVEVRIHDGVAEVEVPTMDLLEVVHLTWTT